MLKPLRDKARSLAEAAVALELVPRGMSKSGFVRACERCAPLHPLTVLALVRLCRKFGQNQRSLFSFLMSREPHGFASFLQQDIDPDDCPVFGLAELYDYTAEALGSGLSVGDGATRWAEVQSALEKSSSFTREEFGFIKVVGLLSAIGAFGELKPSAKLIELACDQPTRDFRKVQKALFDRSIIVERRHSGTIALWEGSNLDLTEELRQAAKQLPEGAGLAEKLNKLWCPRPLVAKRHSFQTGTIRFFTIRFADSRSLSKSLDVEPGADGLIVYCLPASRGECEQPIELAQNATVQEKMEVLVAIPTEVDALRDAVRELELLRWITTNTRQLQADPVARRELRSRIAVTENRVATEVQRLFSPDERKGGSTVWFHHGMRQHISSTRTLADFLSGICSKVYKYTPILKNELINRRSLSSAAAAARRNLIEAMIRCSTEYRLGFEGTPPEVSMYASLFEWTGIHRQEETGFVFGEPTQDDGLIAVWKRMERFFSSCELQRHSVADLFELLQGRPYGLKPGVIPVLFCAAALAHDTEIAFYEGGVFIPEISSEMFDRLVRTPGRFELRQYRVEGVRRDVFKRLAALFGSTAEVGTENLVTIMRPLYRFLHKLPAYCRQTKRLSARTLAIRSALLIAQEPDQLLFSQLPQACGLDPFSSTETDTAKSTRFFSELKNSLGELQRAYDDLLAELQELLFRAFGYSTGARSQLQTRARALAEYCVEPKMKACVSQLGDEQLEDASWIETIATILVGKAPRAWVDDDRIRYEVALTEIARNLRHLEALVHVEKRRIDNGESVGAIFRIGVSDRYSMEEGAVVVVENDDRDVFADAVIELRTMLAKFIDKPQLALAAIAAVSKHLLRK